ncbi:MAG: hypothetical protein LBF01_00815, partial [Bacteroidales bacterium]|nr:hypothetical protein [Bacteroidales bacterium]
EQQIINEIGYQENENITIDTVQAKEKVKNVVKVLQERIKNNLNSENELFLQHAYNDVETLIDIVFFDPLVSSGGRYANGQLFVGTLGFVEGSTDEDIMATVFHEYMHYISEKYSIFIFRMKNREKVIVYFEKDTCFEKKQETEQEFLDRICKDFIYINLPKTIYYSFDYSELTTEQKEEITEYIEAENLKPDIRCFEFQYSPSNYFKDEINAHNQTLNMHGKLFQMSLRKREIYKSEIERYNKRYEKALEFEEKNNYNSSGYENN